MKKIILLTAWLCLILNIQTSPLFAQVIPADRLTNWSNAGYPDSIPDPTVVLDVMNYGAVADGVTDDYLAISSAISALNGTRGVVYFPAGTYAIHSSFYLPDSVILRGAGADSTHLLFDFSGATANAINISGSVSANAVSVISGAEKGSLSILVDDASTYSAGDYVELEQLNGSWDTQPVSWAEYSVGQILHLSSVSGDTLFFDAPLRISYDTSLQTHVRKMSTAHEVGIECLKISRADSVHVGVCFNIYYNYAVNCWVQGVESAKSIGSHIEMDASSNISISGCYIHHCFEYDGTSTHGYGITLFKHTGQCLVENNILRHLRHCYSLQCGSNGNVIAYNYSLEPNRSEFPANYGADISMHGHFTFANLFESNIVQNLQIDQTWGPTGPYNTFFRNRVELYGILMSSGTVESDSQSFVGNEVTNTGAFLGNYSLTGSGHFEYGNNVRGTTTPAGTSGLTDSSYYLSSQPTFWQGTSTWPSIGYPNSSGAGSIPARDRFINGTEFTVCRQEIINGISSTEFSETEFFIFPNPVNNELNFSLSESIKEKVLVQIVDLCGKVIFASIQNLSSGQNKIIDFNLQPGIYFLCITTSSHSLNQRFIQN